MRAACGVVGLVLVMLSIDGPARSAALSVAVAENAYADIARQVAGPSISVRAILTNPTADPHLFEPTASVARLVADANILIFNGAGYDPWMTGLLTAQARPIIVAELLHRRPGDNPHFWYDPQAMPALVMAFAGALACIDPINATATNFRRERVLTSLAALHARIGGLRARFAGQKVAATEPVFALMLQAIGLTDDHARFELAVMNGGEPRVRDVAALQDDLRAHRVRALITNAQTASPASTRLIGIAHAAGVPVVPVTETLPPGLSYQQWVGGELDELEAALSARP